MVLVSFKNIHIRPKMALMPIFGDTFFGHNSAISWPIGLRNFMVVSDEKSKLWCLFFIFWATFGGKMDVATMRASDGLGPPNPTKKLANWVELLGQPLFRNHVFEIFRGKPLLKVGSAPPPPSKKTFNGGHCMGGGCEVGPKGSVHKRPKKTL